MEKRGGVKVSWDLAGVHEIDVAVRSFNESFCKKFYNYSHSFYLTAAIKYF